MHKGNGTKFQGISYPNDVLRQWADNRNSRIIILGFINGNLFLWNKNVILPLYTSLVRRHLEYTGYCLPTLPRILFTKGKLATLGNQDDSIPRQHSVRRKVLMSWDVWREALLPWEMEWVFQSKKRLWELVWIHFLSPVLRHELELIALYIDVDKSTQAVPNSFITTLMFAKWVSFLLQQFSDIQLIFKREAWPSLSLT